MAENKMAQVAENLGVKMGREFMENKMEMVAEMFGKKLGDVFDVKDRHNAVYQYMFTSGGFYYMQNGKPRINDHHGLLELLIGQAQIVEDEG